MKSLQQIAQLNSNWSLEEFVQVANELLPQFLPEDKAHARVREDVTPRLVRHYTSQMMLDDPLKAGREARYTYRHLLQILLVRRLLVEGYGASAINTLARSKDNSELEALLQGGVQLTVAPANPALAFLQKVQQRSANSPSSKSSIQPNPLASGSLLPTQPSTYQASTDQSLSQPHSTSQPSSKTLSSTTSWTRLEILPGLEIHVRSDFNLPATSQEQHTLLNHILQLLISISTAKRRSSKP